MSPSKRRRASSRSFFMVSFLRLQFFLAYRKAPSWCHDTQVDRPPLYFYERVKRHIKVINMEDWPYRWRRGHSSQNQCPLMTWLDWDGGPPLFNPRVCAHTVTLLVMMFTQSPLLLLLTQVKQDTQRWFAWSMSLRKSTLHSCSRYFGKATILHKVTFYSITHTKS